MNIISKMDTDGLVIISRDIFLKFRYIFLKQYVFDRNLKLHRMLLLIINNIL